MENKIKKNINLLLLLQNIDNRINSILNVKNELPKEIDKLKNDILIYKNNLSELREEFLKVENNFKEKKKRIKEINILIQDYEKKNLEIKNKKEYNVINKEINFQKLEIKILEKDIKKYNENIKKKNIEIEKIFSVLSINQQLLLNKKENFNMVSSKNKEEEDKLNKNKKKISSQIEKNFINYYIKIKKFLKNGSPLVTIKREACGGCFNIVPPQKQSEIIENKEMVLCEHCGRILLDIKNYNII